MKPSVLVMLAVLCAFLMLTSCKNASDRTAQEPIAGQNESKVENMVGQEETTMEPEITSAPSVTPAILQEQAGVAEQVSINDDSPSAEENVFKDAALSDELIERYHSFEDDLSPDEYIYLCEVANGISAQPRKPINDKLFLVKQDNSTYNKISEKFLILDISGNVVKEYSENGWGPSIYRVGNFSFVNKYDGNYENPPYRDYEYDIYNMDGECVGEFDSFGAIEPLKDLNDGYTLFTYQGDLFCVMDAAGNCYKLDIPNRDYRPLSMYAVSTNRVDVGNISDGLFYIRYRWLDVDSGDYYAMYYNTVGELVIDLSYVVTNFNVYELGDFQDGLAEVKLIGVDGKNYVGTINKEGNFISEPVCID